jgi:hypothetical protein|tara:strand:- start:22007 stop:22342 length:336 start_codon:yes stop_codon:yes gene_type:complete
MRKQNKQPRVAFEQVLGLANALAKQESVSLHEVSSLIGYAKGTVSFWKRSGEAPELAKWAFLGRLEKAQDIPSHNSELTKEDINIMLKMVIQHGEPSKEVLILTAKLALMK